SVPASRGRCVCSQALLFGGGRPASFQADETARLVRWIDDEDERVVERVVLRLRALVREVETEMQPAVGERRALGLEAQRQRAPAVVPAELCGRHRSGGDENCGVVTQLPADARRSERGVCGDVERNRERLAGEELHPLVAVGAKQPDPLDARDVAAPLLQPGSPLLRIALAGEQAAVR